MEEKLKIGLTLMLVTLIASLALALTNHFTAPKIEIQKELAIKESLNKVMDADSFEEIDGYYDAYDTEGNLVGEVLKVEASGYSSIISALVGVDLERKLTGIDIIDQQETPGLGANVEKESFLSQFIGKASEQLNLRSDGGEIDAITGATITSRAITTGIITSLEELPYDLKTSTFPEWENETQELDETEEVEEIIEGMVSELNISNETE